MYTSVPCSLDPDFELCLNYVMGEGVRWGGGGENE